MDLMQIMQSPLTQAGPGSFLRLVLAEAANYGMPPQVVATLDDVAAMLGFYEPLPSGQAGHLAGPIVRWQTDRRQPTHEHVHEVDRLAMKQRALVAFGGAPADHRIGTAEIVSAMGNCHKDFSPEEFYAVFCWASADVLATLTGQKPEQIRKDKGWAAISDDDVVRPGGRLYPTYVTIATEIRRHAIAAIQGNPDNPREYLRPLAAHFLKSHMLVRDRAASEGRTVLANQLQDSINSIRAMFPDIDRVVETLSRPVEPAAAG
jgi:hypothetical protein